MMITRRAACVGLLTWGLTDKSLRAADTISVRIEVEGSEVITKDLKRIRLAEPADVHFTVVSDYIDTVFKKDLSIPKRLMQVSVIASARRVLGERTLDEALGSNALSALITAVNLDMVQLGVAARDHTLRYVSVPPN